jgi:hypothetical protein
LNESDFQLKLSKSENEQLKKELGELDDKHREILKDYTVLDEKNSQ